MASPPFCGTASRTKFSSIAILAAPGRMRPPNSTTSLRYTAALGDVEIAVTGCHVHVVPHNAARCRPHRPITHQQPAAPRRAPPLLHCLSVPAAGGAVAAVSTAAAVVSPMAGGRAAGRRSTASAPPLRRAAPSISPPPPTSPRLPSASVGGVPPRAPPHHRRLPLRSTCSSQPLNRFHINRRGEGSKLLLRLHHD